MQQCPDGGLEDVGSLAKEMTGVQTKSHDNESNNVHIVSIFRSNTRENS